MLRGRKVLVSGGTGYLGEAICRTAAEYGAQVFFSYCSGGEKAQVLERDLPDSRALPIDLRDPADISAKIGALHRDVDGMDVLVNCAGTSELMPLALLTPGDLDRALEVNVRGTVLLTREVARRMIRRRRGAVVNIGSIAGHRLLDVPVSYAVSKAALGGMTVALASELRRFGIRVNSVVPGMLEDGVARGIPEDLRADYLRHCAAGRAGTGREVAEVVCFLASDRASYVNGQSIFVDGGI